MDEFSELKDAIERLQLTMAIEVSHERDFEPTKSNKAYFERARHNLSIMNDMDELFNDLKKLV